MKETNAFQKMVKRPPFRQEAKIKTWRSLSNKQHRRNYENTEAIWQTIEETTRYESDPIANVINLSKKTFTKETFQLSNLI